MSTLIDDYLSKVRQNLQGSTDQKDSIIQELRSHLTEQAEAAKAADPDTDPETITRRILNDFGAPDDLAVAYTPEGEGVLREITSGEVRLRIPEAAFRVTQAVGRGSLSVLKFAGRSIKQILLTALIAAGIVIVLGVTTAIFLFDDIRDIVEENIERPIHDDYFDCYPDPCNATMGPFTFAVDPKVNQLNYRLYAHLHAEEGTPPGTASIIIRDPNGTILHNLTLGSDQGERASQSGTWLPQEGLYTVEYVFQEFYGTVSLDVYTRGGSIGAIAHTI